MPPTRRFGWGDAVALLALLATSIVIALPIVRGGYLTYIDNSVHLAEIWELAQPDNPRWSEIGFAGFPLGTLHSPLWYPLLAYAVRHGAPLEPIYCAVLVLSFAAPSLALYGVARRRLEVLPSALLAYLLLVQPASIWGIGSPLGGMWTHALSTAGLIVLADLYSRPALSAGEHLATATLLALAVLTHLFVLPLFGLMVVSSIGLLAWRRELSLRELGARILGMLVAAAASAQYWLTLLMVGNEKKAPHQAFPPAELFARLLLPSDAMYLIDVRWKDSVRLDLYLTDAVPILLLVALSIWGLARRRSSNDLLPRTGFFFGVALLLLLVVHAYYPIPVFGPVSFRLIEGVRVGLALSAIAALEGISWGRLASRALGVVLAVSAVLSGLWWGKPLARDNPAAVVSEMAAVRELGAWLASNYSPDWGRVYIQDTFGNDWQEGGAALTHVPVLTRRYSKLPQLGTYYGVVPFQLRWTLSEFNSLYGMWNPTEEWLLEAMEKTNAGILVTSNPWMDNHVRQWERFELLTRIDRYTIFRRQDATNHPIAELTPANHVGAVEYRTDEFQFPLTTDYPNTRVLAKTSFHPWWHLDGIPGATLRESPEGFLVVDDIPRGNFVTRLWYEPDRRPLRVTAAGWCLLGLWAAALGLLGVRRGRALRSAG